MKGGVISSSGLCGIQMVSLDITKVDGVELLVNNKNHVINIIFRTIEKQNKWGTARVRGCFFQSSVVISDAASVVHES